MLQVLKFLTTGLLLLAAVHVQAGDSQAGEAKSQVCQGCHGEGGVSVVPTFPKLAGQYEDYLLQALKEYKAGTRKNAIMQGQVTSLTEADMADLAAYYASQASLMTPETGHFADLRK